MSARNAGAGGRAVPLSLPPTSSPTLDWAIPPPKGLRPSLTPGARTSVTLPAAAADEEARFSTADPMMDTARNRRVSAEALRRAQTRQQMTAPIDLPEDVDELGNEDSFEPEAGGYTDDEILAAAQEIAKRRQAGEEQAALESRQFTPTPAAAPAPGLQLLPITIEDTDRVWDWIRTDADGGAAFFSRPLAHSQALHELMRGLVNAETQGTGLVRSIHYTDQKSHQHFGLAALVPILSTERIALMHLYLRPDIRGQARAFVPWLVEQAAAILPSYHLAVWAADESQRKLYRQLLAPLQFAEHTMFVR